MKLVEAHVAKKQAEFANHAFFSEQRMGSGLWGALSFAPDLTFWVMAFQDILRLNASLTRDPQMRKIVRHHRAEDAGHERWFLDDLAAMQIPAPDVRWLFGERHSPTRDAAYALVSEVYRTTDDRLRLVLVKTLESAGHVFFGRVAAFVERVGLTQDAEVLLVLPPRGREEPPGLRGRDRAHRVRHPPGAEGAHRSEAARRPLLRRLRHDVRCDVRRRDSPDRGDDAGVPPDGPRWSRSNADAGARRSGRDTRDASTGPRAGLEHHSSVGFRALFSSRTAPGLPDLRLKTWCGTLDALSRSPTEAMMQFKAFEPGIDVYGSSLEAIVEAFKLFPSIALKRLASHGIGTANAKGKSRSTGTRGTRRRVGWPPSKALQVLSARAPSFRSARTCQSTRSFPPPSRTSAAALPRSTSPII